MNYDGPNAKLVVPIIKLAFKDFRPAKSASTKFHGVSYVTDFSQACETCFDHGDIDRSFPISDEGLRLIRAEKQHWDGWRETGMNWSTLQEQMLTADVWTNEYWQWEGRHSDQHKQLSCIAEEAWRNIGDKIRAESTSLKAEESHAIGEVIADMLSSIAHARAFTGTGSDYWEMMLEFCQDGYWPCGFRGVWPVDGNYLLWYAT